MTATGEGVRAYPFGPVERLEVDPKLAEICGEQPVLRVSLPYGGDAWLVTRHADVRTVLADPRFSRAAAVGEDIPRTVATGLPSTSMLSMDPPEHSRLRRRVANSFTVRRVEALRPRVQHIVNGLLDTMLAAGGPSDLTQTLTWPLPITVICELLGVPVADRDRFNVWVDGLLMLSDPVRSMEARGLLNDYLIGLVALRRITPTDDLLGELANVADEEDRLLDEELVSLGVSLLSAGQEATANQLGNFVYTLLTRPDLWQKLVADPALVPDAVEELSRIIPISASMRLHPHRHRGRGAERADHSGGRRGGRRAGDRQPGSRSVRPPGGDRLPPGERSARHLRSRRAPLPRRAAGQDGAASRARITAPCGCPVCTSPCRSNRSPGVPTG